MTHGDRTAQDNWKNDSKNLIVKCLISVFQLFKKRKLVLLKMGGLSRKKMPMPSKCRAEDAAVAM